MPKQTAATWSTIGSTISCFQQQPQACNESMFCSQVDQWSVVSSVDDHLVNLWAIIDAHKREEPDYKARNATCLNENCSVPRVWYPFNHRDCMACCQEHSPCCGRVL